jgi:hypothetical protein
VEDEISILHMGEIGKFSFHIFHFGDYLDYFWIECTLFSAIMMTSNYAKIV